MNCAEAGADSPTAANLPVNVGFRAVGMGARYVLENERKNPVRRPFVLRKEGVSGENVGKVVVVARECGDIERESLVDLNAIASFEIVKYLGFGVGIPQHLGHAKTAALRRKCILIDDEIRFFPAGLHDGPGGGYPDGLPGGRLPQELCTRFVREPRICVVLKL